MPLNGANCWGVMVGSAQGGRHRRERYCSTTKPALSSRVHAFHFRYFFFSSRRRHTRLSCDWSSDVCSSDLMIRHTRLWCDWSSDVCSSDRAEEHTSELQSHDNLVCRLLL